VPRVKGRESSVKSRELDGATAARIRRYINLPPSTNNAPLFSLLPPVLFLPCSAFALRMSNSPQPTDDQPPSPFWRSMDDFPSTLTIVARTHLADLWAQCGPCRLPLSPLPLPPCSAHPCHPWSLCFDPPETQLRSICCKTMRHSRRKPSFATANRVFQRAITRTAIANPLTAKTL